MAHFNTLAAVIEVSSRSLRRQRVLRDRRSPFDKYSDTMFIDRYRLTKPLVAEIIDACRNDLQNERSLYSAEEKVFVGLRFLARGSFQKDLADIKHNQMSQSSVSRFIDEFLRAVVDCFGEEYVRFPTTDDELTKVKCEFYDYSGIPNVIGAIDCSHFQLRAPVQSKEAFIDRNSQYSINVEIVFSCNLEILSSFGNFPGSTHDSLIWTVSGLSSLMYTDRYKDCYLLGDSGYAQQPAIMTPINPAQSVDEQLYNTCQKRGRNPAERGNGVLKSRFRALHKSGGELQYSVEKVALIVNASQILHNMCIRKNVPLTDSVKRRLDRYLEKVGQNAAQPRHVPVASVNDSLYSQGCRVRQKLVEYLANN